MQKLLSIFAVVSCFSSFAIVSAIEPTTESLAEIKAVVESQKGVLVDVREVKEWEAGHVQGAISLPISQALDGLSQEERDRLPKGKTLYVHCVLGKRAGIVGEALAREGYDVKVVKPGYKELIGAGFPDAK